MQRFCTQCAGEGALYGVDINTGGIIDTFSSFVWEPSVVKVSSYLMHKMPAFCLEVELLSQESKIDRFSMGRADH